MFSGSGESTITYTHEISIDCSLTKREYEATCTFKNRAKNTINAKVVIPVIFGKFSNKHQLINKLIRAKS